MEILSYRDEVKCKTILKIIVDDDLEDIEEAKRLIAEDTREQLRKYWKIEEELGIPLEVLFKALKDGVVFKRRHNGEICKCSAMLYLFNKTWYIDGEVRFCEAKLKDYGKTWALTREELEND